ncbi:MAG TPA: T9SS type A sorting domain-containing protein, partial [Candidatus Kapabacteria bacterium]|nr:T9SS type A sorting domain-containing protein [Candidatus Kapabacteria bacterium]
EMTRFAPVEVDVNEKPLPIAPIVIVNQRRWDLRNEGSSLIFFRNAPTLASYEGDAVLRTEPLEAFRSATRSITTIDGINRAMSHMLGRLVPVYFRFDDGLIEGTSIRRGADICLWYAPTKEFIEALPHRYRASLESELSAICEVQEKNGSVEEACDRIAGRPSYLELCRVSSGAVNAAMASPNPAHGSTTIGFRLSEPRSVMVTLHDVNGRYLRHLLHEEERGAGEQSVAADLDGVGQGAYLVAVRTDRGEQAVARLIVQ